MKRPQVLLLPLGNWGGSPAVLGESKGLLGDWESAPGIECTAAVPRAGLWRLYVKEKICYFCLKGKSGWVKRWPGNGWGFIHGLGRPAPPVPYGNRSAGVAEAGSASKGGRRVLGRGGLTIPGHIAEKLLWCCIFYLQSPSQAALAECLQPL